MKKEYKLNYKDKNGNCGSTTFIVDIPDLDFEIELKQVRKPRDPQKKLFSGKGTFISLSFTPSSETIETIKSLEFSQKEVDFELQRFINYYHDENRKQVSNWDEQFILWFKRKKDWRDNGQGKSTNKIDERAESFRRRNRIDLFADIKD